MKTFTSLAAIGLALSILASSHIQADWVMDFEDGYSGVPWTVGGSAAATVLQHGGSNILRIQGDANFAGIHQREWLSDVRVAATINPYENTDDSVGVFARNRAPSNFYVSTLNYTSGELHLWKARSGLGAQSLGRVGPIEDLTASYYLEIDVVGERPVLLTARLFDHADGTELLSVSAVDESSDPYLSGMAGTYAGNRGAGLDVSFDDVSVTTILPGPVTLTWDAQGDGNLSDVDVQNGRSRWLKHGIPGLHFPDASVNVEVNADTVTVIQDFEALSLAIDGGGLVVEPGISLDVVEALVVAAGRVSIRGTINADSVEVGSATVEISGSGLLQTSGGLEMGDDAVCVVELDEASNGRIATNGDVYLAGTLDVLVAGRLGSVGDHARQIIRVAAGESSVNDTFAVEPPQDTHLGFGVFHQGVAYTDTGVDVDVFQAAAGDADGNRQTDNADLQAILGANAFNNGTGFDWTQGDFDGDSDVDNADLQLILATGHFGTGPYAASALGMTVVPEPSTIALLASSSAVLCLWLLRRRR